MSRDPDAIFAAMVGQVLMDAWIESTSKYWLRRAADFEWVITGDRTVAPTEEQLEARPGIANLIWLCRHRATLTEQARGEYLETLELVALEAAA